MSEEITATEIDRHYSAIMDSVNLLNAGKPPDMSALEWDDLVARNVGHLKIMLGKEFWTTEDMTAAKSAINGVTR